MSEHAYPEGIDCVWIASDQAGHVAAFVTGGEGPIPYEVFDGAIEIQDIEEELSQLPNVSNAQLPVEMKWLDSFVDMARKGFFVYDWQDVHRATQNCSHVYEPVALPSDPISTSTLPDRLRCQAESVKFGRISFVDGGNVDVTGEFRTYKPSL